MRARVVLSVLGVLALLLVPTGAGARSNLDASYGEGGVARVQLPVVPPSREEWVRRMAASADGDAFVLAEGDCREPCSSLSLFRYDGSGNLDSGFGGAGYAPVPDEGEGLPALAVDSHGRPLVAQSTSTQVTVRRFTPTGQPDAGFGSGGAVTLTCFCEYSLLKIVPSPKGTVTLLLPTRKFGEPRVTGAEFTLIRLRPDGATDSRFGNGGVASVAIAGADPEAVVASAKGNGIYLGGPALFSARFNDFLVRVSRRGRLDRRFLRAAAHSLRALGRLATFESPISAVLVRPKGKIDLLGPAGYEEGFLLRLRANGHPDSRLGARGLRALPASIGTATLGGDGTTYAANAAGPEVRVLRILPGGRVDRLFPGVGASIPGGGLTLVPQKGKRMLLLDLGTFECRSYCAPQPTLVKFHEGGPVKRR